MKRALQRTLAQQDIAKAFDYYLRGASPAVAIDYVHEMDACTQRIERFPEAGSTRYASLLDIDGLRFAVVTRFPYLVFHLERTDYVDIVRVLHQHRDIPDAFEKQAPRE